MAKGGRRKGYRREGNPKIAVAYLRVSTDDQRLGSEAQRSTIESWAAREGVSVVAWHLDEGVSGGSPFEEREALLDALQSVRTHSAGFLVVAKRDRIARDVGIALFIGKETEKQGAKLVSAAGEGNGDAPADAFMRTVIDGAAAYERALIAARTKAALAEKKKKGERSGSCPFGYREGPNGVLLPDESEQAVAARVNRLRADGLTERAIVSALKEMGDVSRSGKPLKQPQVHRILKRWYEYDGAPRGRLIRRVVEPTGVLVDVDLYSVIEVFGGGNGATGREDIAPVIDWIEAGSVQLEVLSVRHFLPVDHEEPVFQLSKWASGNSQTHRTLCALIALYMEARTGQKVVLEGPACQYAGGTADAATVDAELFAECGTLGTGKVRSAILSGKSIIVLPYNLGCRMSVEDASAVAWPSIPEDFDITMQDRLWPRLHMDLAYLFTPMDLEIPKKWEKRQYDRMAEAIDKLEGYGF